MCFYKMLVLADVSFIFYILYYFKFYIVMLKLDVSQVKSTGISRISHHVIVFELF